MATTDKAEWDRIPITLSFRETPKFAETWGFAGTQGVVWLEGQHLRPRKRPSDTVYMFMHPTSTLQTLPMPIALADAGHHVICANSRYPKNDSALIMEKVCFDCAQYVRWAKEEAGFEKVILMGWSGGGALALFYQSQAEHPTITHTPAGDEYDLTKAKLMPADGVIFIAAHLSRAETLSEVIDPSIKDELNPDIRVLDLDIYNKACPNQAPFTSEFISRFRAAQLGRIQRITDWVDERLAYIQSKHDGEMERSFVVHRTWCDLRFMDLTIDPNGRKLNMTVLGEPRTANSAPAGMARFTSLRSWLSQWAVSRSHANGSVTATQIKRTPVLLVENEADDGVPATHTPIIMKNLGTPDKEILRIMGANHYYVGQPEKLKECIEKVTDWSRRKQLEPS